MSRKLVLAAVTVTTAIGFAMPAIAKTGAKHRLSVAMTGHVHKSASTRGTAVIAGPPAPSTLAYQGFQCEVTIGQGPTDSILQNYFVHASTEFYTTYTVGAMTLHSVTTNCVGKLPKGTVHANTIVTHITTNCGQLNPFNKTAPTIRGSGITTTFPSGLYSETCNTPAFS